MRSGSGNLDHSLPQPSCASFINRLPLVSDPSSFLSMKILARLNFVERKWLKSSTFADEFAILE